MQKTILVMDLTFKRESGENPGQPILL